MICLSCVAYLQHLDERDREVEVSHVSADEREGEHDANGDNGAQVHLAGHGDLLARIKNGGEAGEDLGHESRETQMPCCQDNGWDVSAFAMLRMLLRLRLRICKEGGRVR